MMRRFEEGDNLSAYKSIAHILMQAGGGASLIPLCFPLSVISSASGATPQKCFHLKRQRYIELKEFHLYFRKNSS